MKKKRSFPFLLHSRFLLFLSWHIFTKHTLCGLASSAIAEGSFSKTSRIIRSRNRRLSDAHVKELRFISWKLGLLDSLMLWSKRQEINIGAGRMRWLEQVTLNVLGSFVLYGFSLIVDL